MRLLSSLLVALALFLASVGMSSDSGMAMAHRPSAEMTGMDGHCAGMAQPEDDGRDFGMAMDCMSACSAIAPAQPGFDGRGRLVAAGIASIAPAMPIGIASESETPPPRFA